MRKIISLDFWGTLAKSNPKFKEEQYKIARQYSHDLSLEEFKSRFKLMKAFTDEKVETTGIHPSRNEALHVMFPDWSLKIIEEFIHYSEMLFLKYPPKAIPQMIEQVEKWKNAGHILYISSNTVFIHGETLSKVIFDLFGIVKSNCKFSDEVGLSKPEEDMWNFPYKPTHHIGDNPKTDGICVEYGIEFIHVDTFIDEHKVKVGNLELTF